MQLRDYQIEGLNRVRRSMSQGKTRVILYSPTGSGKTLMGLEIIKGALAKGKRCLFAANRIGLVHQASEVFTRAGILHGIVQGNNTRDLHHNVLIASIQSLNSRGYPPVDLIIIDEAHGCAGSKEYKDLLEVYNGVKTVGLTATPFSRGLGKQYEWGTLFEDLVVASTIPDLIRQGHLVDVDIYAPSTPDLSKVSIVAGDYNERELGEAVDKPTLVGDIVAHWKRLAQDKPTVCFATNIPHSKHIVESFRAAGVKAEHIDCYTPEDERHAILKRVDAGETRVISNVAILAEGWDQPSVSCMILARPTKSLIRYIQMAGRILRPYPGKAKGLVLDHSGSSCELGYPTEELPLLLDDGKPKTSTGSDTPKEKLPKACPSCQFVKPAGVHKCPQCGFAPERKNSVEVEAGTLAKMERLRKLDTGDKAALYGELKTMAVQKGWSKGRLAHVFKDLTGVWPNHYGAAPPRPVSSETEKAVRHLTIRFVKAKEAREAKNSRPTHAEAV